MCRVRRVLGLVEILVVVVATSGWGEYSFHAVELTGEVLDLPVTARTKSHQEVVGVRTTGEDGDDVVGVVLVSSARFSVFPALLTFRLFVSSSLRETFPGLWGEER